MSRAGEAPGRQGPPLDVEAPTRCEARLHLDAPLRHLTRLTLRRADPEPPPGGPGEVPAELLNFSRLGFRFRAPRLYDQGARLACRLELATVETQSLAFDAEIRWCVQIRAGEYEGGARIIGGAPESRLVVFERFLDYHRAARAGGDGAR